MEGEFKSERFKEMFQKLKQEIIFFAAVVLQINL